MTITTWEDNVTFIRFLSDKPSILDANTTATLIKIVANDEGSVDTPAGPLRTLGIKMKSRGAISAKQKLPDDVHCSDLHAMSLSHAMALLSHAERAQYGNRTLTLRFGTDKEYQTGLWDFSKIEVSPAAAAMAANETAVVLVAPRFLTADWIPGLGGMFYCKLAPPTAISEWIRVQLGTPVGSPSVQRKH